MGAAKPVCRQNPVDAFGGLAGFDCLIRVQIVQGAPGMGFDIADWFLFLGRLFVPGPVGQLVQRTQNLLSSYP